MCFGLIHSPSGKMAKNSGSWKTVVSEVRIAGKRMRLGFRLTGKFGVCEARRLVKLGWYPATDESQAPGKLHYLGNSQEGLRHFSLKLLTDRIQFNSEILWPNALPNYCFPKVKHHWA